MTARKDLLEKLRVTKSIVRVRELVGELEREGHGALIAAAQDALEHLQELRDAWQRGVIDERDGRGGTRSNRNVAVEVNLRFALETYQPLQMDTARKP